MVQVEGMKNPMMHSYRMISAGLDAFEEHHALAPAAPTLRFRLRQNRQPVGTVSAEPISLRIVGDGSVDPVVLPVGEDGIVTIPRIGWAVEQKADLIFNRKKNQVSGMPDVRTPGLPANARRLGDLRLQCKVLVGMLKSELNIILRAAITTALTSADWCGSRHLTLMTQAPGMIAEAFLSHGNRSAAIKFHEDYFDAPIANPDWPDDALIEVKLTRKVDEVITP